MRAGRRRARELALQMLYQQDLGGRSLDEIVEAFDALDLQTFLLDEPEDEETEPVVPPRRLPEGELVKAFEYAATLVRGVEEHREEIDAQIRRQAVNWRLERMPVIDRNLLRLAVFEMLWVEDVPQVVILDEAIELAKQFGSEKSSRFVNGLLDGVMKRAAGDRRASGGRS